MAVPAPEKEEHALDEAIALSSDRDFRGKRREFYEWQDKLLEGGVQRCQLSGLTRDGALVLRLTRGDHDVYSLTLGSR